MIGPSCGHRVLVSFKAFGDLVIALDCYKRSSQSVRATTSLLLGGHLLPLFKALSVDIPCVVIEHGTASLPSLFTVKKDGVAKAWTSARSLRAAIANVCLPNEALLIFDRLGIRERWVTQGRRQVSIGHTVNIYLDYDRFLAASDQAMVQPSQHRKPGPLRIFPGSRMPAKNLPIALVREIVGHAADCGSAVELMLLEGERPDLEQSGIPHTIVRRQFSDMIAAVEGAGRVVSADSMPAHIAEMACRDVFVFSPVPNRYWLPRSTYLRQWDALFADGCRSRCFRDFLVGKAALPIG